MIDGKNADFGIIPTLDSDELDAFDLSEDSGCLEPQASLKDLADAEILEGLWK